MKDKEITVYKVLQLGDISAIMGGKAQVRYVRRVWSKAPGWLADHGYHLTCFRTLTQAKNFAKNETRTAAGYKQAFLIWTCAGRKIISSLPEFLDMSLLEIGKLRPSYRVFAKWPPGTLMVKSLKLGYLLGIYHRGGWYPHEEW